MSLKSCFYNVCLLFSVLLQGCGGGLRSVDSDVISIVRPANATAMQRLAAKEIRRYFYLRTGTLMPIVEWEKGLSRQTKQIMVGVKNSSNLHRLFAEHSELESTIGELGAQQYLLKTVSDGGHRVLLVVGGDDAGVLYGAYRLAEHVGVRFFLHGDTIPDGCVALELPDLNRIEKPLFALRGIQPFHDFPEGPDWWNTDDYKAIIAQVAKLRMNFIGLHTYPEGKAGPEPTVWTGLPEDVNPDGTVKYGSVSSYQNTVRGNWGYAALESGKFSCGSGQIFERDTYGSEVMYGLMPVARTAAERNELFERVGDMLAECFEFAGALGVKRCVGTESPLTIPSCVKERLEEKGLNPSAAGTIRRVYRGIFTRIKRRYPVDYYWLWTPETWTWHGAAEKQVSAVKADFLHALGGLGDVGYPFKLATCGWVLGPPGNRLLFDQVLPQDSPMSCINREMGKAPVDESFKEIGHRPKWAIPWLEDDAALISPQLWVGRMRKDAADALDYGCTGLMGIHWRTRILAPNVLALAWAGWEQSPWRDKLESGLIERGRFASSEDFYQDWAEHEFGAEEADEIGSIFTSIDCSLPATSGWIAGPGGIIRNRTGWPERAKRFSFVERLCAVGPRIKGAANRSRFDYWLNTFRYTKSLAELGSTLGQLDAVVERIKRLMDSGKQCEEAGEEALELRKAATRQWSQMLGFLQKKVSTNGEMGTIANLEQHNRIRLKMLTRHDSSISEALGRSILKEVQVSDEYRGPDRLFVPTVRTLLDGDEDLMIKARILTQSEAVNLTLHYKSIGCDEFSRMQFKHIGRGVYSAVLSAGKIQNRDFEYYISSKFKSGNEITYPVTAPERNQTVVVVDFQRK